MIERQRIQVRGIVQGVGFRPFVYDLATRAGLVGRVRNEAAGVTIEIEGEAAALKAFTTALAAGPPTLAVIEQITVESLPPGPGRRSWSDFSIAPSQSEGGRRTLIAPDIAPCDDCLRELFDPTDRRYRYPFINCTNCGPRFTIICDLPYDRPSTTMASFIMCPACRREYEDPADRRYHAQPIACPACGPSLALWRTSPDAPAIDPAEDPIAAVRRRLSEGWIVAIKGLGGYHLACDPANDVSLGRLRLAKRRYEKPFALMAADIEAAAGVCQIDEAERALLDDPRRPVVLLQRRPGAAIAEAVAPRQNTLGIMLPYTPLHHLLFSRDRSDEAAAGSPPDGAGLLRLLVMTSGNPHDEPIVYRDEDVFEQLAPLADYILTHDRPIRTRCDDSVSRLVDGRERLIRRARGYAPRPLRVDFEFREPVLAVGGHLKNAFCLGQGRYALMSHHIGDLQNLETLTSWREGIDHIKQLFAITPRIVAHDLHPDYLSTRYALDVAGVRRVPVQHHHAHIASVLAENHLRGAVIGVAFDGTGYGPDGTVWGGEFLVADYHDYDRAAHLRPIHLAGGEQAIAQPWRLAAAWLDRLYGPEWIEQPLDFCRQVDRGAWAVMRQMIDRNINSPLTSSMGRLFDAAAALLGIRQLVTYEGQAAVELEALADGAESGAYPFAVDLPQIDPAPVFESILADLRRGAPISRISARFHNGVVGLIGTVCDRLRDERGLNRVALSGGVFQNARLLAGALTHLRARGFEVFANRLIPTNDGGLALGQAAIASFREARVGQADDIDIQLKERSCV